ncbi:hypothetical protein J6590_045848 [Homalodisca vitripennis]|nr:hypothetical protein J6590_045848 [Homalodisca vitripennis]
MVNVHATFQTSRVNEVTVKDRVRYSVKYKELALEDVKGHRTLFGTLRLTTPTILRNCHLVKRPPVKMLVSSAENKYPHQNWPDHVVNVEIEKVMCGNRSLYIMRTKRGMPSEPQSLEQSKLGGSSKLHLHLLCICLLWQRSGNNRLDNGNVEEDIRINKFTGLNLRYLRPKVQRPRLLGYRHSRIYSV